jgi:hypothetical protein
VTTDLNGALHYGSLTIGDWVEAVHDRAVDVDLALQYTVKPFLGSIHIWGQWSAITAHGSLDLKQEILI